jgi:guanylate kinase
MPRYLTYFLGIMLVFSTICFSEGPQQSPPTSRKGFMIAISAPSGTGKSTIIRELLKQDPNLTMTISVTTRPMRTGEIEGKDYFFVSRDQFLIMDKNQELLEKSENYGNLYGITQKFMDEKITSGKDVLIDLNWDGVQQLTHNKFDLITIFILPPSLAELEKRLRNRATDKEEAVQTRLAQAKKEIKNLTHYGYVVINDDLEKAINEIKSIIIAERLKQHRQNIPNY